MELPQQPGQGQGQGMAAGRQVLLSNNHQLRGVVDQPEPVGNGAARGAGGGSSAQAASGRLFLAVGVCCVSPLLFGFSLAFTSPTQITMEGDQTGGVDPPPDLHVFSQNTEKWYASLFNIGAVLGAFAGATVSDRIGRKKSLALTAVPHCVAWVGTAFAKDSTLLILLRVLCGFAVGMGSAVTPCYIGEIATAGLRGSLGAANQLSVTAGIFAVNLLGKYAVGVDEEGQVFSDWRHLSLVGVFLSLVLLLMLSMPESPKWLAKTGKQDAAKQALRSLRQGDISAETAELLAQPDPAACGGAAGAAPAEAAGLGAYRMSLLIGVGLCVFQQCSGVNAIMMYTTKICEQAQIPNAGLAAMVSMAAQVVLTGVACALMERTGRRPLLLFAAASMTFSHMLLAYYYLALGHNLWGPSWLALLAIGIFIVGFSLGLGPIPWLILAEIFPTEVRGTASSLATATNWSCSFFVTLLFQPLQDALSPEGAFFLFGLVCLGCFVFVKVLVPETRGKSVEQVLLELRSPLSAGSARSARDVALGGAAGGAAAC